MAEPHKTTIGRRGGGGYGYRCSCGASPNRETKRRKIAERWAKDHEATHSTPAKPDDQEVSNG